MNQTELQIMFHKETGLYAPTVHGEKITQKATYEDYIKWLEEKVITLYRL